MGLIFLLIPIAADYLLLSPIIAPFVSFGVATSYAWDNFVNLFKMFIS